MEEFHLNHMYEVGVKRFTNIFVINRNIQRKHYLNPKSFQYQEASGIIDCYPQTMKGSIVIIAMTKNIGQEVHKQTLQTQTRLLFYIVCSVYVCMNNKILCDYFL